MDLYNTLGYSAAALGNHEWDWGRDSLRARMRQARYPVLGANVQFADGRDVGLDSGRHPAALSARSR